MNNKSYTYKKRRPNTNSRRNKPARPAIDVNQYINEGKAQATPEAYVNQYTFADFGLDNSLEALIAEKGYKNPSEVQDKAIKPIMEGRDLIGIAGTGTGKTAAFLIPIIQMLLENRQENLALVIAPTRELANQIQDEFKSLTHRLRLYSTCLIGGTSVGESIRNLKRQNHLIIGTPGRLQDMANQKALDYSKFNILVLDEFDRMLDMGFSKEVEKINQQMTNKEQSLLFSATLDPSQKNLVNKIVRNPVTVQSEHSTHTSDAIDQKVIQSNGKDKFTLVKDLLSEPGNNKTILFCETKRHADRMVKKLLRDEFSADAIHGNKTQRQREKALNRFKTGRINVLVATDVVARGIDVENVELVINYQAPMNYADYIHRIGRTGRAGKVGRAVTLID